MPLEAGEHIGPYEVVAKIGAGGMGEVYRAHDRRLGRDIAIKVMSSAYRDDLDRLRRFHDEVRAIGALDHPNVLVVHDVGDFDGAPYLVCELLEGQTLRTKLAEGKLDRPTALKLAHQIADGLHAIHRTHIVHRDLKPANLMILANGRVKILDFGIARTVEARTDGTVTKTGAAVGTVAYMAPEQIRGEQVDHRADIFAFGLVLYEMLAGGRPFTADTDVELGYAILKDDPPRLDDPAADALVRRCLAKDPSDRYQSAHDLAFAIETLAAATPRARRRRRFVPIALAGAAVVASLFVAGMAVRGSSPRSSPQRVYDMRRLTERRGVVQAARFAPDGKTYVYAASWNGQRPAIYMAQLGEPGARMLVADARLMAVSRSGDLAVLTDAKQPTLILDGPIILAGTLSRTHLQGGGLRELATNVVAADWLPDGNIAASRYIAGRSTNGAGSRCLIEWPLGNVVYEGDKLILTVRSSPTGDRVAFLEETGTGTALVVIDRDKHVKRVSLGNGPVYVSGMVWDPDGQRLWLALGHRPRERCVYVATLAGDLRPVQCGTGSLGVEDIDSSGRLLVTSIQLETHVRVKTPTETEEREVPWEENLSLYDLSQDGRTLVFGDNTSEGQLFVRDVDADESVVIGTGAGRAISPDGAWIATTRVDASGKSHGFMTPVKAGQERPWVTYPGVESVSVILGGWSPDSKTFYAACSRGKTVSDTCACGLDGICRRVVEGKRPAATAGHAVSPDGKWFLASDGTSTSELLSTDGTTARALPDTPDVGHLFHKGFGIAVGWSRDGTHVFVTPGRLGAHDGSDIDLLDLSTGVATRWKTFAQDDPSGSIVYQAPRVVAGGDGYSYSFTRRTSALYLMEPFR